MVRKTICSKKFETHGLVKTKASAKNIARNLSEFSTVCATKVVKVSRPVAGFKYKVLFKEKRRKK